MALGACLCEGSQLGRSAKLTSSSLSLAPQSCIRDLFLLKGVIKDDVEFDLLEFYVSQLFSRSFKI